MKLSDELLNCRILSSVWSDAPLYLDSHAIINNIKQLESYSALLAVYKQDSQLLEDLIEMMQDKNLGLFHGNAQWAIDEAIESKDHSDIAFGQTPREAIEAAIKEWKK